jgi:hypothetical protein
VAAEGKKDISFEVPEDLEVRGALIVMDTTDRGFVQLNSDGLTTAMAHALANHAVLTTRVALEGQYASLFEGIRIEQEEERVRQLEESGGEGNGG